MNHFLKLSVLAVLLSLASAAEEFEFDEKVLKENHEYDYDATLKVVPLNVDAVEKIESDDSVYPYPDILMLDRENAENDKLDEKCSGHLGALHPVTSEVYCLDGINVDVVKNRVPRRASFELLMSTPDREKSMVLMIPLFKDSAAAKDKKVLRFEPLSSEQITSLAVPKTIDFSAPWIKELLEKPVNKMNVGTSYYTDYVTYPVVMAAEKFDELLKFVESYTNQPYPNGYGM